MKTKILFDMTKTIATQLFESEEYPWQILRGIKEFVVSLGESLDKSIFNEIAPQVWVAKSAKIYPSAYIMAPCIIDENSEVRHGAFIRGSVIVGKNCVVGNSTEMKNCIIFDDVQIPHYNYVGDSILGFRTHFGAGAITSNVKSDKSLVTVLKDGKKS